MGELFAPGDVPDKTDAVLLALTIVDPFFPRLLSECKKKKFSLKNKVNHDDIEKIFPVSSSYTRENVDIIWFVTELCTQNQYSHF